MQEFGFYSARNLKELDQLLSDSGRQLTNGGTDNCV